MIRIGGIKNRKELKTKAKSKRIDKRKLIDKKMINSYEDSYNSKWQRPTFPQT